MPISTFACDLCNTVDIDTTGAGVTICTKCREGQWHDYFAAETFDPKIHECTNRSNSLDPDIDEGPSFG